MSDVAAISFDRMRSHAIDGRDEAFVGGGSGSKSNSILLVVRDSTPDCHLAIACDRLRSLAIACDRMRSLAIA